MRLSPSAIPRLKAHHLLGHIPAMQEDMLALQLRIAREGPIVCARLGVRDTIWLSAPGPLAEVLIDRAEDFEKTAVLRVFLRPLIGDGILSNQGSQHKRRRAIVAPGFQAGRISQYADAIAQLTDRVIDEMLTSSADGAGGSAPEQTVDAGEEMLRLTLEAVGATIFHTPVASDVRAVGDAVTQASEAATAMLRSPVPVMLPPSRFTKAGRAMLEAAEKLDRIVYRIIHERRAGGEDPGDVLSMLLAARDAQTGEGLTDEELRDEVMTLFLAGHETTANALTWALQLIAAHPDVARKLNLEVDTVLQGRLPAFADLGQLPYSLAVFKEAMRLYPPAYLAGRSALVDTRVAGQKIARGQIVFCNIYGVQRDPSLFPEPDAFRPERFLDNAEKRWPKAAYIPFSVGPRVCVGNHFALMEGQLVLARFAQRLELAHSIRGMAQPEPLITLRPKTVVRMAVRPRSLERKPASHATDKAS